MKIAINGAGVAGPALAWWLKHFGYEPVLFERAPKLRTGGYMIDFWGIGYRIAERMGVMPELKNQGYDMQLMRVVGHNGQTRAQLNIDTLRNVTNNQFISIPRSAVAATLYRACQGVETRFGTCITEIKQHPDSAEVTLSNGTKESFDLVIGADGLHSHIRNLTFGAENNHTVHLGAYVSAFTLSDYQPREDLTYIMHPAQKKQVARVSLRNNKTLFLFTFRSELVRKQPRNLAEQKQLIKTIFGDMAWETPAILARLDEASDFYFDQVNQVRMNTWHKGRVALIGDAAACVSLLAGEGTGLAITEAYVLANELHRAAGNHTVAFRAYEEHLKPFINQKQQAASSFLAAFAPKNKLQMALVNLVIQASSVPFLSKQLIGRSLKDDVELPDYMALPQPD